MFVKFAKNQDKYRLPVSLSNKLRFNFGSLEAAYEHYGLTDAEDQEPFYLFSEIVADKELEARAGQTEYLKLVNEFRGQFLDEGVFGKQWLCGYHIRNTMLTLQKKNEKFGFLGLISYDCDLMLEEIKANFYRFVKQGKT